MRGQGDDRAAAGGALDRVLAAEPRNIVALVMKGDIVARTGDDRAAGSFYGLAWNSAQAAQRTPAIAEALARAEAALAEVSTRYVAHLRGTLAEVDAGPRFAEAVAIVAGEKQPYFQAPTSFFYPGLPHIQFYDPAGFAWAAELEGAVPAIRAELEAAMAGDAGFKPYVEADPTRANNGHKLLGDPSWSAFYLWENGARVTANADRCPATMAALADLPIPVIARRSPMALFSVLKPGTHIEPHNGMLNTRLIVHLPLIVPPDCRLRVGNDLRAVEAGKLMMFDDSIQHEAWNDSTETRVVLLFEVWRPELSVAERDALTRLFEATGSYGA